MPEAQPEREPPMHRSKPQHESFAHFYLTRVALGEGCGCAEQAVRLRELEGLARGRIGKTEARGTMRPLNALLAKLRAGFAAPGAAWRRLHSAR
jgi:hypothetical protein